MLFPASECPEATTRTTEMPGSTLLLSAAPLWTEGELTYLNSDSVNRVKKVSQGKLVFLETLAILEKRAIRAN